MYNIGKRPNRNIKALTVVCHTKPCQKSRPRSRDSTGWITWSLLIFICGDVPHAKSNKYKQIVNLIEFDSGNSRLFLPSPLYCQISFLNCSVGMTSHMRHHDRMVLADFLAFRMIGTFWGGYCGFWEIFLGSRGFWVWEKVISSRGGFCVSAPFVSQMGDWPTVLPALLHLYSLVTRLGCLVGWALRMHDLTPINWQVPNWTLVDSSHAACWSPPLASIQVQVFCRDTLPKSNFAHNYYPISNFIFP